MALKNNSNYSDPMDGQDDKTTPGLSKAANNTANAHTSSNTAELPAQPPPQTQAPKGTAIPQAAGTAAINAIAGTGANMQNIQNQAQAYANQANTRTTPVAQAATSNAAQVNMGANVGAQEEQQAFNGLSSYANGSAPSAAAIQQKQGIDSTIAAQAAAAGSARNGAAGSAQFNSMTNMANTDQAAVGQAAALRANEQQAGMQQLSGLAQGIQGQNIGLATNQAGLTEQTNLSNAGNTQQTNLANQNSTLANQAQANQMIQQYLNTGMSLQQAQLQAETTIANQTSQNETSIANTEQQGVNAEQVAKIQGTYAPNTMGGLLLGAAGGALSGAASGGAMALASDKNVKENINPADKKVYDMLSKLKPVSFDYKDPKNGEGEQTGIIAQDLEKSKAGNNLVEDTPDGKQVKAIPSIGALFSAVANLHHRLDKIEKKR